MRKNFNKEPLPVVIEIIEEEKVSENIQMPQNDLSALESNIRSEVSSKEVSKLNVFGWKLVLSYGQKRYVLSKIVF